MRGPGISQLFQTYTCLFQQLHHVRPAAVFVLESNEARRQEQQDYRLTSLDVIRIDVDLVNDLDFDTTLTEIRTKMHSIHSPIQRKNMRDQRLHIDQSSLDSCNTSGPCISISVDELDIDLYALVSNKTWEPKREAYLSKTQMHKRDVVDYWSSKPNDQNGASSAHCERCCDDAALCPSTL